jgi:hypothetical protein
MNMDTGMDIDRDRDTEKDMDPGHRVLNLSWPVHIFKDIGLWIRQSNIGSSDSVLSPISFSMDIGLRAHLRSKIT